MDNDLVEGDRIGRFLILRDVDGITHAVATGAVAAMCQTDDGVLIMLPGGRLIHVPHPLEMLWSGWAGREAEVWRRATYKNLILTIRGYVVPKNQKVH